MNNCLSLDVRQRNIYDSIYDAVSKGKTEFSISSSAKMISILNIIKIVLGEHANLFYYDNCKIHYSEFGNRKIIKLTKWANGLKLAVFDDKFKKESQEIIARTIKNNMNKMQKVLAIHNYLVNSVSYHDAFGYDFNYQHYHTAYGAIVEKSAVCEGISAAFCYLLGLVGIDSTIVNGSTEKLHKNDHCWNIVCIDNKFYHFDVTWDLKNKMNKGSNCFDYFGLKDSDLKERTWNKELYRSCDSNDMNFFNLTKAVAKNEQELVEIGLRQCQKGNDIYVKCLFIKNIHSEDEVCSYIFDIISRNHQLSKYFLNGANCSVNLDQSIVYVSK